MISTKKAASILFEKDEEVRNKMIDKLSEEDCKVLLKTAFKVIHGDQKFSEEMF